VLGSATIQEANWSRSNSFSAMYPSKLQRNIICRQWICAVETPKCPVFTARVLVNSR